MCIGGIPFLTQDSFFKKLNVEMQYIKNTAKRLKQGQRDVTKHLSWSTVTMLGFMEPSDCEKQ